MSGFLLHWQRGSALDATSRDVVVSILAHRGPQGVARHDGDGVFAVHTRFEDAIGAEDDLPLVDERWVVAADLRLDDRHQLRARLRDEGIEPATDASDARLLLGALRAWGADAPARLLGDFAFAALDRAAGTLVAARSIFGVKGLFTAETADFVACSNDLDALCALPGVDAAPDEAALTEFLYTGGPVHLERTPRRGVRRVPPAQTRAWAETGTARANVHRELPTPRRLRLISDDEYVASFREILDVAVVDRIRSGTAGILMSGGLDSTALAASAARALPNRLRLALTMSTEPLMPDLESRPAAAAARRLSLRHEVMQAVPATALAHCDDPTFSTAEPIDAAQLLVWRRQVARLAREGPVAMHGEDGDALLAPPDLLTMMRTLPWIGIARSWLGFVARHGGAPWSGLRRALESPRSRAAREADEWRAPVWLRHELIARHARRPEEPPPHRTRPQAAGLLTSVSWESFTTMLDARTTGVAQAFVLPYLDLRLIEFVFALPPIPWMQRKWMLRRAFVGALPEEVLTRPKSPLRGYREVLVAHWRASGGAERHLPVPMDDWIDVAAWRRVLRESTDAERVMEAWRVFELSRWLAQPAFRG